MSITFLLKKHNDLYKQDCDYNTEKPKYSEHSVWKTSKCLYAVLYLFHISPSIFLLSSGSSPAQAYYPMSELTKITANKVKVLEHQMLYSQLISTRLLSFSHYYTTIQQCTVLSNKQRGRLRLMMSGGMNSDYFGHFAPFFLCLQVIENILKLFAGSG